MKFRCWKHTHVLGHQALNVRAARLLPVLTALIAIVAGCGEDAATGSGTPANSDAQS